MCVQDGILLQQIRSPSTKSSKQIEQQLGKLKVPTAAIGWLKSFEPNVEERYSWVSTAAQFVLFCFIAVDDLPFS